MKRISEQNTSNAAQEPDVMKTAHEQQTKTTEVVFILDASGSMFDLTEDTIGGFNAMIKEQKDKDERILVSTVCFNTESHVIHDRVPISEIGNMTERDYRACGGTALIDAMGDAIHHIKNVHKYIRKEDVPDNTLFVITTDGMENSSHRYSSRDVKKMVEDQKEKGWEFIFMGANIDAVETAAQYGIDRSRASNYVNDRMGSKKRFGAMAQAMRMVVEDGCVAESWKDEIEADVMAREK